MTNRLTEPYFAPTRSTIITTRNETIWTNENRSASRQPVAAFRAGTGTAGGAGSVLGAGLRGSPSSCALNEREEGGQKGAATAIVATEAIQAACMGSRRKSGLVFRQSTVFGQPAAGGIRVVVRFRWCGRGQTLPTRVRAASGAASIRRSRSATPTRSPKGRTGNLWKPS